MGSTTTGLAIYEFNDGSQPFIACVRHNQGARKAGDLPAGHGETRAECDLGEPVQLALADPVRPHGDVPRRFAHHDKADADAAKDESVFMPFGAN